MQTDYKIVKCSYPAFGNPSTLERNWNNESLACTFLSGCTESSKSKIIQSEDPFNTLSNSTLATREEAKTRFEKSQEPLSGSVSGHPR